jgi:hypothetical protein
VLAKLRRVWPGLAILAGLIGGFALCAHAMWGGMLEFAPDPGCRGGGCAGSLADRAAHNARWFAIGVLGGGALLIIGVAAAVRRRTRRLLPLVELDGAGALGADGCRSGKADRDRADALAPARLRQRGDRVVSK